MDITGARWSTDGAEAILSGLSLPRIADLQGICKASAR